MTEPAGNRTPSLLVFSDDWGRHPSSCQHLIGHLLPRYRVRWVNTIGMRRPSLGLSTIHRGLEKAGHWFLRHDHVSARPDNLEVMSPIMWPWFSTARDRWINRKLLVRCLASHVKSTPRPVIAVTTIPIVADLMGCLPVDRWVYYCVDDFSEWPGVDQLAMRDMEDELIRKADRLITVSDTLQEKLGDLGRQSRLITHGVDLDFWRANGTARPMKALRPYERPLVVFWGLVDQRIDVAFVQRLADEMTEGTILLVGPAEAPDTALLRSRRVVHVPPLAFAEMPQLAAEARVFVMPYRDVPVTRAMQPLKLKEYLAAEKPAIVRDLPATRPWADCLDLCRTPEAFSKTVRLRLSYGLPESQRRCRRRLSEESWTAKAREFEDFVLAKCPVPT